MPTNADSARRLAQTIALTGACGSFEDHNFNRAKDMWVFTCQKQEMTFEIVAYGSEDARSAGIKTLDECCRTAYFARNFYAVEIVAFGSDSADVALAPLGARGQRVARRSGSLTKRGCPGAPPAANGVSCKAGRVR